MFKVDENTKIITMNEGDFGIILPITFNGDVLDTDIINFIIRDEDKKEIINKSFNPSEKILNLQFTQEETKLLPKGRYFYGMKQFRDNILVNSVAVKKIFIVEEGE